MKKRRKDSTPQAFETKRVTVEIEHEHQIMSSFMLVPVRMDVANEGDCDIMDSWVRDDLEITFSEWVKE